MTDSPTISNQFNNFFVNIGPKLASTINNNGKHYYEYLHDSKSNSMFMKPIVENDIFKIIAKLNDNKSAGPDNIGNYIIKRVCNEIIKPLTNIFNLSITSGVVPEKTKMAKVIPVYKKADAKVFSNYRPVSLLSCFSKILERLVFDKCIHYINANEIRNSTRIIF